MIQPIITNVRELRKPSTPIGEKEDISILIQDLKDTLKSKATALGLSACQIGVNKKVCFIRVPKKVEDKIEFVETLLINPKITHKEGKCIVNGEGCLSLPGLFFTTDRYSFVVVEYENEQRKINTIIGQGIEATLLIHEIDHTLGLTLFERKHKAK